MARNEEKARSMLSRYLQSQKEHKKRERRPYLSTLCDNVDDAEKWRNQVLGEIRRLVSDIQNIGLEDDEIREINDKINKLLRERYHWEKRIKVLGGVDYERQRKLEKQINEDGVLEHKGRFYFGTARNLPEVKELIENERIRKQQAHEQDEEEESKDILNQRVNEEYYGDTNKNDEESIHEQKVEEEKYMQKMSTQWETNSDKLVTEPWDWTYVELIGKKPSVAPESDVQAVILESKKVEALEQLRLGIEKNMG